MHRSCRRLSSVAFVGIAASLFASSAQADSALIQWTTGTGANNHYYQRIDSHSSTVPLTYAQAAAATAALPNFAVGSTIYGARLAVLDPDFSNAFTFVRDNVMYGATGSGAAGSNQMYWVGATSPSGDLGTYTWVNGQPLSAAANGSITADHFEGPGPEGLGYFQNGSTFLWDYITTSSSNLAYGYVVEYAPVPEPTSLACLGGAIALNGRRRRAAR